jgi:FixJ family two-component response regulator
MPAELAARGARLPVVYLSAGSDVRSAVAALKGGAADFLVEPVEAAQLAASVAQAVEEDQRRREYCRAVAEARGRLQRLSPREREVLALVVQGAATKEVAAHLGVGARTVETHRRQIRRKVGVQSVAGWVRLVLLAEGRLACPEFSPEISVRRPRRCSP